MQLEIYKDYEELSQYAADTIINCIKNKPNAVLCLATGDTPRLTYKYLVEKLLKANIDISGCTFIGLDEWVGIPPETEGSCHYFLQENIFKPLSIRHTQIHLFDALATDLDAECKKMNKVIADLGGIDLMVVGVGMNGHIGFNEPGVALDSYALVTDLEETTKAVGQKKYFDKPVAISKGITLGLQNFLEAKQVIMLANGTKKALIIKAAVEEPTGTKIPATIMRMHNNSMMMIDDEAASQLTDKK
jgi:galactosamine-6-phosphate isomerase